MIGHGMSSMIVAVRNTIRTALMRLRILYLRFFWGHELHPTSHISFSAYLDRVNPKGIVVGPHTIITRGVVMLSHDYTRSISSQTKVGGKCLIGVNAIICPGVTIGDEVVVGAGAVVTRDVPSNCLVVGNPAKVVGHIRTDVYGRIIHRA